MLVSVQTNSAQPKHANNLDMLSIMWLVWLRLFGLHNSTKEIQTIKRLQYINLKQICYCVLHAAEVQLSLEKYTRERERVCVCTVKNNFNVVTRSWKKWSIIAGVLRESHEVPLYKSTWYFAWCTKRNEFFILFFNSCVGENVLAAQIYQKDSL